MSARELKRALALRAAQMDEAPTGYPYGGYRLVGPRASGDNAYAYS
jgi:hypothetical protein